MSSEFVLQTKHGGKDSKSGVITHLSIEKFEVSAYGHSVDNVWGKKIIVSIVCLLNELSVVGNRNLWLQKFELTVL